MILQISAAVAAVAFVVLAVYLILALRKLTDTLTSVDSTLREMKPRLEEVADESSRTLKEARHLLEDARLKSEQTDAFFQAVNGMGNSLQELSTSITRTASVQKERLANVTAVASVVMDLWKKWRSEKGSDDRKPKRVN
ncbi:DUF948 domain-containing protein [Desmospora profundinema]|uniref:Uncharacterized protein YoxC n=1 Tax=Desmospora profundinema TaxID=1571184 RepID=A0ABU1IRL7_9BACL|nr:DUF948 domain-containing protein [Desmospora profundinema]MDR6227434.1 uncharacterized protein YoxC [Desmospora profundinema]